MQQRHKMARHMVRIAAMHVRHAEVPRAPLRPTPL
jgi:hypothetical protein